MNWGVMAVLASALIVIALLSLRNSVRIKQIERGIYNEEVEKPHHHPKDGTEFVTKVGLVCNGCEHYVNLGFYCLVMNKTLRPGDVPRPEWCPLKGNSNEQAVSADD
jgi:hypothetical protein